MREPAGLCGTLGVGGWDDLDAVLLAALASEAPVLLVGAHGTAKTMLVRRLAGALGAAFRHYNASLLNYDDLVGIPLPDDAGTSLRFVTLPAAVWDAEFVFFDEISRCRPDLQNKLFPIVHDRVVQGLPLRSLVHRWAAMNPPAPTDAAGWDATTYVGSEELDPALADRFAYVVAVPGWQSLPRDVRMQIASGGGQAGEADAGHVVAALVGECRAELAATAAAVGVVASEYAVGAVDLLCRTGIAQSPRRCRMLAEAVVAVHTAAVVLARHAGAAAPNPGDSAFLALRNTLPQAATANPPPAADLLAVHRQAFELAASASDSRLRAVLAQPDPLVRAVVADDAGCDDATVSHFVTGALAAATTEGRRLAAATALFLRFCGTRDLTAAAWEPLGSLSARVLTERDARADIAQGAPLRVWEDVNRWLCGDGAHAPVLERNFVLAGVPDVWLHEDWRTALAQFRCDLATTGVAA